MPLQTYVQDIIEMRRNAPLARGGLFALSTLFKAGVALRNVGYDRAWFKVFKSPLPVISVGNIVAGGTGKTPLIRLLLQELVSECRVALLSRGYRSQIEKSGALVNLAATPSSPEECGDEPFWLSSLFPQVSIWVGKNRVLSAQKAFEEGAECLLLDDGMQHRRLHRDLDIVVMDGQDLFGKNHFLPRGYLRDSKRRLSSAGLIVVNHAGEGFEEMRAQIAVYSKAPVVGMEMRLEGDFKGKRVGVFCGIGKPHYFVKDVGRDAQIVDTLIAADHCLPTLSALETFAERCRDLGADCLVCTEKDAVKLPKDLKICLPISTAKGYLKIVAGEGYWNDLILKIKGMRYGRI